MKRMITGLAVCLTLAATAAPAMAAPVRATHSPNITTGTLNCGGGPENDVDVVVHGGGAWTPALSLEGTTTYQPVAFGEFNGVITDSDGNVVDEFTDPALGRSGNRTGQDLITCTFTSEADFTDVEGNLLHFKIEGEVLGKQSH